MATIPRTSSTLERHQFAYAGAVIVDDTAAHTGDFYAVYFPVASSITACTLDSSVTGSLVGKNYAAGTTLFLRFTSITLASGEAHCYKWG